MIGKKLLISAGLLLMVVSGCSPAVSIWRHDAKIVLDKARLGGAYEMFPQETKSAEEALLEGEALFKEDEVEQADNFFFLAWSKGILLEENLAAEKKRRDELKKKAEAEKREIERQRVLLEEQRRLAKEKAEAEARAAAEAEAEAKRRAEKARQIRERPLPSLHTVKRGETLPLIAAQSDVYNDPSLWPLLYRANRDQIRDPKHIWPGQVLRIPRSLSREDLAEARRYAQEKPIY